MEKKWSIGFEKFIQNMFRSFKVKNLQSEISNNAAILKLKR